MTFISLPKCPNRTICYIGRCSGLDEEEYRCKQDTAVVTLGKWRLRQCWIWYSRLACACAFMHSKHTSINIKQSNRTHMAFTHHSILLTDHWTFKLFLQITESALWPALVHLSHKHRKHRWWHRAELWPWACPPRKLMLLASGHPLQRRWWPHNSW